jgi:hypothetical protein
MSTYVSASYQYEDVLLQGKRGHLTSIIMVDNIYFTSSQDFDMYYMSNISTTEFDIEQLAPRSTVMYCRLGTNPRFS